jgi:hypothetical protein
MSETDFRLLFGTSVRKTSKVEVQFRNKIALHRRLHPDPGSSASNSSESARMG